MKSFLPFLTFAVLLTSCSSVYKSGQTPDDVYFSPARPQDEYVRTDDRNSSHYLSGDEASREERYLRMKARNPRYGLLENDNMDCYCYNGPNYYRYNDYYRMNAYHYNQNWWNWNIRPGGFYSYDPIFYNPYYYNPYYRNPYYSGVVYGNVSPKYNRPRTSNLTIFGGNGNSYNSNTQKGNSRSYNSSSERDDNYRGSNSSAGGFLRDIFSGSSSSSSNSSSNKTYSSGSNNSSSSSSSSSSSGSSGSSRAPVRRF